MSSFSREIALSIYRWMSMRKRRQLAVQFQREGTYPATILFYHRIADSNPNDWSITNANFIRHLDWIQQNAKFASLDDICQSQSSGRSEATVGVTFDDGYSDNLLVAIPELIRRQIPCTYFVSTHFIETGEPFPHDLKAGTHLKPNTIQEIQSLAAKGITIGGHTHTHIDLGKSHSAPTLKYEISDSRKKLQDWTQQPIHYFAFPYGLSCNITPDAIDAVFEAGFRCFVSAAGGLNWPGTSTEHLQRVHGDPGIAAIQNWITLDPRKLRAQMPVANSRHRPLSSRRTDNANSVTIPS